MADSLLPQEQPARAEVELYLPRTPILSASETARLMGFPTGEALGKARQTGRLPIPMFQLPGRKGWFAATRDVRAWLEATLCIGTKTSEEGKPMDR